MLRRILALLHMFLLLFWNFCNFGECDPRSLSISKHYQSLPDVGFLLSTRKNLSLNRFRKRLPGPHVYIAPITQSFVITDSNAPLIIIATKRQAKLQRYIKVTSSFPVIISVNDSLVFKSSWKRLWAIIHLRHHTAQLRPVHRSGL